MANQNFRVKNGLEVGNIKIDAGSGIITATKFVGDGSSLTNLPSGGGGTSDFVRTSTGIHTSSKVGLGTTSPNYRLDILGGQDPNKWVRQYFEGTYESSQLEYSLQEVVGATAVDSLGNIYVSGAAGPDTFNNAYLLKLSPSGDLIWQLDFSTGNPGSPFIYGDALHIDSSDNVYLGINIINIIDVAVLKLNTNGEIIWQRLIDIQFLSSIITDSAGDVYVSGSRNNFNGWLGKLSASDGSIVWQRDTTTGSVSTRGWGIVGIDTSDNLYITGSYISGSYYNAYIQKYNSSGTIQWQKILSGITNRADYAMQMGVDSSNNVYFLGYTFNTSSQSNIVLVKFDTSGNVIWQKYIGNYQDNISAYSLAFDSTNNIYIFGTNDRDDPTDCDILLFKLDSSGNSIWQKRFGGEEYPKYQEFTWFYNNSGHKNIVVKGQDLIVTGQTSYMYYGYLNQLNALIAKFSIDGNFNGKYGDFLVEDINLGIGSTSHTISNSSFTVSTAIQSSSAAGLTTSVTVRTLREEEPTILNSIGGRSFLETINSERIDVNGQFNINGVPFTETQASCKNIVIGVGAGVSLRYAVSNGYSNIFVGAGAGRSTTSGSYNVFFGGCYTGHSNIDGWSNNFMGAYAGQYNTSGSYNNFFSYRTGLSNTTGCNNNFIGPSAGRANTTGSFNNFFGSYAGYSNTIGRTNNFYGDISGYCNTTGCYNNFFGSQAGYSNTSGCSNNYFGGESGKCNTTGSYNNFYGTSSGYCNTTGTLNNYFGSFSGNSTEASFKVILGSANTLQNRFDSPSPDKDKQFAVGVRTDANPAEYWLVGNENLNIGIGTTNPTTKLQVGGTVTATAFVGDGSGLTNLPSGGGGSSDFVRTSAGIHTLGNVGVGTTNPRTALQIGSVFNRQVIGFGTVQGYSYPGTNILIGDQKTGCSLTPQVGGVWKGLNNIFMGIGAGSSTTTGNGNNFFGNYAGRCNTTGYYNNFFGLYAGLNNTTGHNNNFLGGYCTGRSNTSGSCNNFFGMYAGANNTTGTSNNFIGNQVAQANTIGSCNNFIGVRAGRCNTSGNYNNFIGYGAGYNNDSGSLNNFLGCYSGNSNSTGSYNTFIGNASGYCNTTGQYNSSFGNGAGKYNVSGNYNIFLGYYTGSYQSRSYRVILGTGNNGFGNVHKFDSPKNANKQFAVGLNTTGTNEYWLVGNENFNIGIGTTNPTTKLQVGGTVTATAFVGDGSGLTNLPSGGGGSSDFVRTSAGIHTLGNVGVGTTNPRTALQIGSVFNRQVIGFGTVLGYAYAGTNVLIGDEKTGSSLTPQAGGAWKGLDNTFIGASAGAANTTGNGNIFIGLNAGCSNTEGSYNNFFGLYSGCSNTTGKHNNFLGSYGTGKCNTTGCYNNFFGFYAGKENTTGSFNFFGGYAAGKCNTTGIHNNFIGYKAGFYNTNGSYNNFIGYFVGLANTTGLFNDFYGYESGRSNTVGGYNSFYGSGSGCLNTTGCYNSFFGYKSGQNNTTGRYNSFFGNYSGRTNTTGRFNLFLGGASGLSTGASYKVIMGSGNGAFRFDSPEPNKDLQFAVGVRSDSFASRYWITGDDTMNLVFYNGIRFNDDNIKIGFDAGKSNNGGCNIFIGNFAGYYNTTGDFNHFFGKGSGNANTTGSYNVFMGESSGECNTIGCYNNFIGHVAGKYNANGICNNALGLVAGNQNKSGSNNTFLGNYTGVHTNTNYRITIGNGFGLNWGFDVPKQASKQLAIGIRTSTAPAEYWLVGDENFNIGIGTTNPTTALTVGGIIGFIDTNVRIGDNTTGAAITSGINNTFIGVGAGSSNAIGSYNTFLGFESGKNNSAPLGGNSGSWNTFIGHRTGLSNTSIYNTFIGAFIGQYNTTGGGNIFVGGGYSNTTGSDNSFVGEGAGSYNTTGYLNSFFGKWAGECNLTGSCNIAFGFQSGYCNLSGNNNTFLGNYTGVHTNRSYRVILGGGDWGTEFDSPKNANKQFAVGLNTTGTAEYWLVGNENFNIGIGTTNPTTKLQVGGTVTATAFVGNGSGLTNLPVPTWTLGANGSSDYTFTGIGFTQTTNDPILYLARGGVYEFVNNSGGSHPFEIRVSDGGAAYNAGVTNNAAASGVIRFEVPFDAPNTLYYQCTAHSGMGNTISVYPDLLV